MVLSMKYCVLLFTALLGACTLLKPEATMFEPELLATGESVTTTGRYFSFVTPPSILIFSETRDWRHEEGIAGANLAIMKAAKEMGHSYFTTEHSGVFNDKDLERFDVIVFNNMSGDALTPEQEAAFARWHAKGNGTVLIHGAGDSSYMGWSFYENELLGAKFVSHIMAPQFQEARIEVINKTHPVMNGVPSEFMATDEWYTFEAPPNDNFIILAGLDESTYSPKNTVYGERSDLRMGPNPSDHPIIWARCYGEKQARTVFTAMGHQYETYEATEATLILTNALNWVARKSDLQSKGCIH